MDYSTKFGQNVRTNSEKMNCKAKVVLSSARSIILYNHIASQSVEPRSKYGFGAENCSNHFVVAFLFEMCCFLQGRQRFVAFMKSNRFNVVADSTNRTMSFTFTLRPNFYWFPVLSGNTTETCNHCSSKIKHSGHSCEFMKKKRKEKKKNHLRHLLKYIITN